MMMIRHCAFVLLILLTIQFAGCSAKEDIDAAKDLTRNYFSAIEGGDYDKALSFYGEQFFENTSREHWKNSLRSISSKLGTLEDYNLSEWRVELKAASGLSGVFIEMHYKVTYSLYPVDEFLTLFKPIDNSDFKIIRHQITSDGFAN